MDKIDYKKHYKNIYLPSNKPTIIQIPPIKYITVNGEGNPNGELFGKNVEVLYALSYAIKMSYKNETVPGYYEYTVFPLEGVWDLIDITKPVSDKDNFKYKLMIRQPEFLTNELFDKFVKQVKNKKPQIAVEKAKLEVIEEGLCCQMMHFGGYDDEPVSFAIMEDYCLNNAYKRISKIHKEVYISDPRKVETKKRKTTLRFKVEKL